MSDFVIDKKNMLPVEFILFKAQQGWGKTSAATAMLRLDYKYHAQKRTAAAQRYYDGLNRLGHNIKSLDGNHIYYSSTPILLNKKDQIYTHDIDFLKLTLPDTSDPNVAARYYPKGSVFFITEADTSGHCHNWKKLSKFALFLYKFFRQNNYTIIFDLQDSTGLIGRIFNFVTLELILLEKTKLVKRFFLFKKLRMWHWVAVSPQLIKSVAELKRLGVNLRVKVAEGQKFYYRGYDIFKCFNTNYAEAYFLDGLTEFTFEEYPKFMYTPSGISQYVKSHPLVLPDDEEDTKKTHCGAKIKPTNEAKRSVAHGTTN